MSGTCEDLSEHTADVVKVVAKHTNATCEQTKGAVMERCGLLPAEAEVVIRNAMMEGFIYETEDGRYARTGFEM